MCLPKVLTRTNNVGCETSKKKKQPDKQNRNRRSAILWTARVSSGLGPGMHKVWVLGPKTKTSIWANTKAGEIEMLLPKNGIEVLALVIRLGCYIWNECPIMLCRTLLTVMILISSSSGWHTGASLKLIIQLEDIVYISECVIEHSYCPNSRKSPNMISLYICIVYPCFQSRRSENIA